MKYCPGSCGTVIAASIICCDPCWSRIPTDLPSQKRWRTARKTALALRDWARAEDAQVAAVTWLLAHPERAHR